LSHDSGDAGRKPASARLLSSQPTERRGHPSTGRIIKLLFGQSHGFIRLRGGRAIYFHRSDMQEGTPFNDLVVGDAVTFELLEDPVSGARAIRVIRRPKRS
jgi:hypothetical protein